MAINVNGTTVINDSRGLSNISSIDSATTTTLSNAGVSGVSTPNAEAVGAYAYGRPLDSTTYNKNDTTSSLNALPFASTDSVSQTLYGTEWSGIDPSNMVRTPSGTWRCTAAANGSTFGGGRGYIGLWVRIS
jgi:hypothetical protein